MKKNKDDSPVTWKQLRTIAWTAAGMILFLAAEYQIYLNIIWAVKQEHHVYLLFVFVSQIFMFTLIGHFIGRLHKNE